jgi:hypothetical protein
LTEQVRRLQRLIHAQSMLQAKHERQFAQHARDLLKCEDDIQFLLGALDRGSLLAFQSSGVVSKRLKILVTKKRALQSNLQSEQHVMAQSRLRIELLVERQRSALEKESEDQLDNLLEEWVLNGKHVS